MMKTKKYFIYIILSMFLSNILLLISQTDKKPRTSLKTSVSQRIGVDTDITIDYSRPGVKGRKIWGGVVPFGMNPGNEQSNFKPFPWRGGANENTTIYFNKSVFINGNKLNEGKYSLHFIPSKNEWIIIFNNNSNMWGSFQYNEKDDALRIKVYPTKAFHQEWLTYGFENFQDKSCVVYLHWEKLKIPFKVSIK